MADRGTLNAQWIPIAAKFPATLNKDAAPETLADGETPDSYGIGIDKPGWLYYEASPSAGDAWQGITKQVSNPTSTPIAGSQNWRFFFNKLWGWTADYRYIYYGANGYDSNYVIDGLGYFSCVIDNETASVIDVIPFGNNVAVLKGNHLYVVRNADTPSNNLVAEYVKQGSGIPSAGLAIAMDRNLIWVNINGAWLYNGENVTEMTVPVRNNLGTFTSASVTSLRGNFEKRRLIGYGTATKFIIDLSGQASRLFDYGTSGFRFTTRTLTGTEGEPILIDAIGLIYQYSASESASIGLDVKINDTWKSETQYTIRPANDNGLALIPLSNFMACRKFALRITSMSPSLYISSILVHVKTGGIQGYSNK